MGWDVKGAPGSAVVVSPDVPAAPAPQRTPARADAPATQPMEPPQFKTPVRQGPATAKGLAPEPKQVVNHTLMRSLWHAKDVNSQVASAIVSSNQFNTLEEIDASIGALPSQLWNHATVMGAGFLARVGLGPDMSKHDAGPDVVSPTGYYRFAHYVASLAKESGTGNCGDKASMAAVMLADRGLHPVEIFFIAAKDHGFCVVGRAQGSDPADPTTWGPNAVIVDPWANESYAVADLVKEGTSSPRMRGLLNGTTPRFERSALIAGRDPSE